MVRVSSWTALIFLHSFQDLVHVNNASSPTHAFVYSCRFTAILFVVCLLYLSICMLNLSTSMVLGNLQIQFCSSCFFFHFNFRLLYHTWQPTCAFCFLFFCVFVVSFFLAVWPICSQGNKLENFIINSEFTAYILPVNTCLFFSRN